MQRLRNKRKRATVSVVSAVPGGASAASFETHTQDAGHAHALASAAPCPTTHYTPSEQTEAMHHGTATELGCNDQFDKQNVNNFKTNSSIATILDILHTHMAADASRPHNMSDSEAGCNGLDVPDLPDLPEKRAQASYRHKRVAERVKQIINETPFIHMLSSMAKPHTDIHIPLISRKYEEKFMRACVNMQERPCSMNTKCECMFIDPENAFVGTRFLIPNICGEQVHLNTMCILCLRKHTLLLFYKTMHAGYDPGVVIQRYGNICNEPGEYSQSAMIFANPNGPVQCMPLPIVAHQRNRYTVVRVGGVPHLRQHGVDVKNYPEPGFRVPPAEI